MKNALSLALLFAMAFTPLAGLAQEQSQISTSPSTASAKTVPQETPALTNKDVIDMSKTGVSAEIIMAKIKASNCKFDTSPSALQELKAAGVSDAIVLAMIQASTGNNTSQSLTSNNKPARIKDELTTLFQGLQTSVVTVWSELGRGTGFIFDKQGLVMTNQHVVSSSEYIAVQFNDKLKVPAVLLASNPEKDVAILWIDLTMLPEATVATIADTNSGEPIAVEGERVLTIGSPLNQRKIMTTGIVSKVEERAIISDININHGNSGGPLFNSLGQVIGITTFGDFTNQGGPGISGIVRIEETLKLITEAREKMAQVTKPEAKLLPVDPTDTFPIEAIKEVAMAKKFDDDKYMFGLGEYRIALMTPTLLYRIATEAEREAAKTKDKRNKKEGAVQGTFRPFEEFRNWREYVGDYRPVLFVQAMPNAGESFFGALGRGVAANYGILVPAKIRYKTDFYRMKLFCGEKEIEPIHPGKVFLMMSESNRFINAKDATFAGLYAYPADAISTSCGQVRLEVFSEKNPKKADTKLLDPKSILRVATDFEPYLKTSASK